jgi:beta-galactosidase/beta-glucuronidase
MDVGQHQFHFVDLQVRMALMEKLEQLVQADRLAQAVQKEVRVVQLVLKVQLVRPDPKVKLAPKEFPDQRVQLV